MNNDVHRLYIIKSCVVNDLFLINILNSYLLEQVIYMITQRSFVIDPIIFNNYP